MIAIKTQLSLRNARQYFREHLSSGDYYNASSITPGPRRQPQQSSRMGPHPARRRGLANIAWPAPSISHAEDPANGTKRLTPDCD
jgi:hypothetical protein